MALLPLSLAALLAGAAAFSPAPCLPRALVAAAPRPRPQMAAGKKKPSELSRREALSGGGFDQAYNDFANAGLREPLLFGSLAATAYFGVSQRGKLTGAVAALDAGQLRNSNGAPEKHLPLVTLSRPKPKFKVQLEVRVPHVMDAQKPHFIEYIWLKDESTNEVLTVQSFAPTDAAPPTLVALVDEGRRVVPMLHCNLHGLWEGEPLTASLPA